MLQEPLSEDDAESEASSSCTGDEDYVEVKESNSQTEQDTSSEDDTAHDFGEDATHHIGKDKAAKWKKTKPETNVKTRSPNIVSHLPVVKVIANEAKSPLDYWTSQVTNDML
ncbi:hypothetical protein PR048_011078 [Dryococelus australis]|uniref:Uncharacterized protein n=1 Tax=Dryococelus australis TaxID=614101 RepID=A0ABQ9HKM7_9NEOP|nr:hypothetical protein PR048_011078 [Dryococelus australis]